MNPISQGIDPSISGRRMSDVRKQLRIDWYRCPVKREDLVALSLRSDLLGCLHALGYLGLLIATGTACYLLFGAGNWAGFVAALFVHGTAASFISAPHHELCHGTVFRTRWLNNFFLRIFSTLGWLNFHVYKFSHSYHHRYTLFSQGDREEVLPENPSLRFFYLLQLFTINISGGYQSRGIVPILKNTLQLARDHFANPFNSWGSELYAEHPGERRKARNWARWLLGFHATLIAVSVASGQPVIALIVSGAPFIANWWRYFVGVPMHCGLRSNVSDFRKCVRTIRLDPLSEFLYWHMNWHLEHHMYANVPCYRLKGLYQRTAADMPQPRSLFSAWKEIRQTWKRQQTDPDYAFDTPVPPASNAVAATQGTLHQSIGELAPAAIAEN
jgi:fatty acid desaturase